MVPTADWGYLRLRRTDYGVGDLEQWVERVRQQPWQEVFVFFKHEETAGGPELADRFAGLFEAD